MLAFSTQSHVVMLFSCLGGHPSMPIRHSVSNTILGASGNYASSPAGVGVWVVPGGRGWTPTFAIALFAAPAGVGAWVVPGGRRWTPNSCDMSIRA